MMENDTPAGLTPDQVRRNKFISARRMAGIYDVPVFQVVENGKKPAFDGWQQSATRILDDVEAMWRRAPDFNIGISTTGLIVVDLDPKDGGEDSWREIVEEREMYGDTVPDTLEVQTWSGGRHIYFRAPLGPNGERIEVRGSVGKNGGIAPGVDIRAHGGLVVGPGSVIDGKPYRIIKRGADGLYKIALAPEWLVELTKKKVARAENAGERITEETPEAIEEIRALVDAHPPVGQGVRNISWYKLAARFGDAGGTIETARDEGWRWVHEKVDGGMEEDEFEKTLASAYGPGRANPIGNLNPGAMPEGPEWAEAIDVGMHPARRGVESVETKFGWLRPKWREGIMASAAAIPPLVWFIKNFALRRKVAILTGPGGVAKSTLGIHIALEGATGIKGICGLEVLTRERVWIYNQEDDEDDIARRVVAVMQHKGIKDEDLVLGGRSMLSWNSGVEHRLVVAHPVSGMPTINHTVLKAMRAHIIAEGIGLLLLDPLAEFHDLDENKNLEMRMVLGAIRDYLAAPTGCTVIIVAHPVKTGRAGSEGLAGNMDSLRGAGSQGNSVRGAATLFRPSKQDIKTLEFAHPPVEYARLDFAKSNFGKMSNAPIWFHISGVTIANGEEVGVLTPVQIGPKITVEEDLLTPFAEAVKECGPGAHQLADVEKKLSAGVLAKIEAMGKNKARDIRDKLMLGKDVAFVEGGRLIRDKVGSRYTFRFEAFKQT